MIINILYLITMYPVLFIIYFVMRNLGDAKDGYSCGVRMKAEWMKDSEVQGIVADYKKQLKVCLIILAAAPLASFAIPYISIAFTVWMIWILAVIGVPMIPYVRANGRLRGRKREMNWAQRDGGYTFADLKSAQTGVRCVKPFPFLPPILISGAAGAWGLWQAVREGISAPGNMAVILALTTLLFYVIAVVTDRQKNEVISQDSDVNISYNRARKNLWKKVWLLEAWLNTGFVVTISATLAADGVPAGSILTESVIYTLAGIVPLLAAARGLWKIDVHYGEYRDLPEGEEDGDGHWIGGMLYYNKNDTHTMVNMRGGIGTTMNLATPAGIGMTAIGGLALLVIPISCIWMILEEFTPLRLAVKDQVLTGEHLKVEYEIPVSEIEELELLGEHPVWSKVSGTGMDHLLKGTFHIRNVGNCEVLMDPQNSVFLRIETADTVYYMSAQDDAGTQALYGELEALR